ncbi:hypothetical protein [Microtetraspora malaysiensis]|nr:hypothetical protein [Microtetraspora malaysiensis]
MTHPLPFSTHQFLRDIRATADAIDAARADPRGQSADHHEYGSAVR